MSSKTAEYKIVSKCIQHLTSPDDKPHLGSYKPWVLDSARSPAGHVDLPGQRWSRNELDLRTSEAPPVEHPGSPDLFLGVL